MLGRTGLDVSRVGLGLAAVGRPAYLNLGRAEDLGDDRSVEAMRARSWEVLDAARDSGITYFDAARSYGRAEEFLATWIADRHIGTDEIVVGSKWGYTYTAGWNLEAERHEVKDHSLAGFRRQLAESLQLLGAHLRLYQVHSVTPESPLLNDAATLDALAGLRAGGVAVGITLSGTDQAGVLRKALATDVGGAPLFESVQATWNLLEQSAAGALEEAHESGMGVIVKEALANGRLTRHNRSTAAEDRFAPLHHLAARRDASIEQVALAAALAQPWADVVLSGAASAGQVRSNTSAALLELGEDELGALGGMSEKPDEYWARRHSLPWS